MTSTLATRKQAEAIRLRMQKIRNELPYDADVARAQVQQLTDWKYHLRRRPWPILTVAAVAGYLLVPSKSRATSSKVPNSYPQTELRSENVDHPVAKKSLLSGLAGAVFTMALRTGTTIAARQLSSMLLDRSIQPRDHSPVANQESENSKFDDCTLER